MKHVQHDVHWGYASVTSAMDLESLLPFCLEDRLRLMVPCLDLRVQQSGFPTVCEIIELRGPVSGVLMICTARIPTCRLRDGRQGGHPCTLCAVVGCLSHGGCVFELFCVLTSAGWAADTGPCTRLAS